VKLPDDTAAVSGCNGAAGAAALGVAGAAGVLLRAAAASAWNSVALLMTVSAVPPAAVDSAGANLISPEAVVVLIGSACPAGWLAAGAGARDNAC